MAKYGHRPSYALCSSLSYTGISSFHFILSLFSAGILLISWGFTDIQLIHNVSSLITLNYIILNPKPNTIQPRILIQHGHFHFTMHTNILLYVSATNAPFGYSISMDYYNSIHLYLYFIIIMISTVNDPLKRINTLLFLRVFFAHHPQHPFQPPFFQQTIINHSK